MAKKDSPNAAKLRKKLNDIVPPNPDTSDYAPKEQSDILVPLLLEILDEIAELRGLIK